MYNKITPKQTDYNYFEVCNPAFIASDFPVFTVRPSAADVDLSDKNALEDYPFTVDLSEWDVTVIFVPKGPKPKKLERDEHTPARGQVWVRADNPYPYDSYFIGASPAGHVEVVGTDFGYVFFEESETDHMSEPNIWSRAEDWFRTVYSFSHVGDFYDNNFSS
jgi:hypothetical protein